MRLSSRDELLLVRGMPRGKKNRGQSVDEHELIPTVTIDEQELVPIGLYAVYKSYASE
jgi:hypothetical protein